MSWLTRPFDHQQIQLRWKMFRASPHETLDRDMRCLHHPQLSMAGKESDSSAKQKRHDVGDLKPAQATKQPLTRDTVFGERSINSITTFNTKQNPY